MRVNIKALQKAYHQHNNDLQDSTMLYAYLMHKSGAYYTDIGKVLGISRQQATNLVKKAEKLL